MGPISTGLGEIYQYTLEVDTIQTISMPESPISIDGAWVAIRFMSEPESNSQFAYNNAYYLMAEMKKGDVEHSH